MRVPDHFFEKYQINDVDSQLFLSYFDEPEGGRILEVGAHDEPCANVLSEMGFDVTGVDLREYHAAQDIPGAKTVPLNYTYLRGDFCDMPEPWLRDNLGTFDCIFCLSAIEHFGLETYGEGRYAPYYDVVAARLMWQLLKMGGSCYLTIPFLSYPVEVRPHWRAYSLAELAVRLVQDFHVESLATYAADDLAIGEKVFRRSEQVPPEDATKFSGTHCNLTAILKMRKVPVGRIAPDGG